MFRLSHISLLAVSILAGRGAYAAPGASEEQIAFFEKSVRPVLIERCYDCHSEGKKIKGGLALDTREAIQHGGDSGQVLVPGEPDKSLLIEAIRYTNHDMQMPPKKRLADSEIKALEDWVKMGAPDPRESLTAAKREAGIDIEAGRKFWSFTPLQRVEPPTADLPSPIDGFIQAKLAEKGLKPAPPADRRTLIRRATFDLIGLPPTPEEITAFLSDTSPEAFDKVIEGLLASPHYGERWGRHWLDLARYADSNGMDENIVFGNAWRYRDYVVRAFNNDKPFDQFLIEQIAGDLLPHNDEAITATGFLALGARILAEPDVQKLEMDIIDEQLDTLGKAFMGMTFGCARCHDHKFDPVSQEDYYAMAAIFRSTRSLSAGNKGTIKYWHEQSIATPEEQAEKAKTDEALKAKKAEVAKFISQARSTVRTEVQKHASGYLAAAALLPAQANLTHARALPAARELDPDIILSCRQYLDRNAKQLPPVLAAWQDLAQRKDADAVRRHYEPLFADALTTKKGAVYTALTDAKGFLALPAKDADVFDAEALSQIAAMNKEVTDLTASQPDLPALMSVEDADIVRTLPVHIRGSYLTLGNPIERGFPKVMQTSATSPVFPVKNSGRLELARWMASSEHPLTARVLVNRVWRWHFGAGLVNSTDNFGVLGSTPSHPEMLDWLARTFIENGWSIKDLHRRIMKSATYQQASSLPALTAGQPDPRLIDPENRLLWRANIQRLEAEQIRDAMLATSGWLNTEIGGKTVPLRNKDYVFNHTSKDATTYESARRALYLPIIRNHLYDMLEQFDYPDTSTPNGNRNSTVIAPQALIMMNAPVVMESASRLATRLKTVSSEEQRVQHAYELLYGRPPTEREKSESLTLLQDLSTAENTQQAWALFCQTLLAANEFIYLR